MKTFIFMAAFLMMGLQLNAQGIVVNKTDGTKVYFPAEEVESVAAYGYGEEPEPEPEDTGNAPEGIEAVDLGLPSRIKWANMNLGATAQDKYGLFYAWGENQGYSSSKTSDGRTFDWASYKWMTAGKSSWHWTNKYQLADNKTDCCWYDTDNNFIGDGKETLDVEDDAAHAEWGGDWYMPTNDDINELLDNTISEWTTLGSTYGCIFTSKINGNAIFLPAAGCRISSRIFSQGTNGYYWSSSLLKSTSFNAFGLTFDSSSSFVDGSQRYFGRSIRPILRKRIAESEETDENSSTIP